MNDIKEVLGDSILAQIHVGVKIRLVCLFNSHPEAGHQDASIEGEGFTFEDALKALVYRLKENIVSVVAWAKANGESNINPKMVYLNNLYYYYLETSHGKIYLNTENPSLYDPYCYPREQKTLYGPSGYGIASLFPQECFTEAEKKVLPMDILDSCVRDYINKELKEDFDEILERQEQSSKDYVGSRVREMADHYKLTKSDLLKIVQDMEDD